MIKSFWSWYERHYLLNVSIALGLFSLQITHLVWLFADVIFLKLFGFELLPITPLFETIIILVDYTEIPALITTGLIYVNELRKKYEFKNLLFLILLFSQFLHIFWITDEFVVEQFTNALKTTILPFWLAWVAILIDYLEVPVIIDTTKRLVKALKTQNVKKLKEAFAED